MPNQHSPLQHVDKALSNMDYLIRFIQMNESFRQPETDAIAQSANVDLEWVKYKNDVCAYSWRR